jgi:hypothetical protein
MLILHAVQRSFDSSTDILLELIYIWKSYTWLDSKSSLPSKAPGKEGLFAYDNDDSRSDELR